MPPVAPHRDCPRKQERQQGEEDELESGQSANRSEVRERQWHPERLH
jgi:hypothetical protein